MPQSSLRGGEEGGAGRCAIYRKLTFLCHNGQLIRSVRSQGGGERLDAPLQHPSDPALFRAARIVTPKSVVMVGFIVLYENRRLVTSGSLDRGQHEQVGVVIPDSFSEKGTKRVEKRARESEKE